MKCSNIGRLAISALLIAMPLSMASAADMPLKAPPPAPAPVYSWTGFYGGANVGYSWGRSSDSWNYFAPNITTGSTICGAGAYCISGSGTDNLNGVIGGLQAGYNWQTGNLLAGIETDFQWSGQRRTENFTTPFQAAAPAGSAGTGFETFAEKLQWLGTLRGRIGYAPGQWLFYATGGLAYGRVTENGNMAATGFFSAFVPGSPPCPTGVCPVASFSNSVTKAGWTIGVGTERAIDGHWSLKAEYLYVDLGTANTAFTGVPGCFGSAGICNNTAAGAGAISSRITDNIFRVGVNYKLGGP